MERRVFTMKGIEGGVLSADYADGEDWGREWEGSFYHEGEEGG